MRLDRKINSSKHQPRVIKNQTSIVDKIVSFLILRQKKKRWFSSVCCMLKQTRDIDSIPFLDCSCDITHCYNLPTLLINQQRQNEFDDTA